MTSPGRDIRAELGLPLVGEEVEEVREETAREREIKTEPVEYIWNTGLQEYEPEAYELPVEKKKEGKGGKWKGQKCWYCGKAGHFSRECWNRGWQGIGKGKGKGQGKTAQGQGKGGSQSIVINVNSR